MVAALVGFSLGSSEEKEKERKSEKWQSSGRTPVEYRQNRGGGPCGRTAAESQQNDGRIG